MFTTVYLSIYHIEKRFKQKLYTSTKLYIYNCKQEKELHQADTKKNRTVQTILV
jgi:hypothetical protein